jgi:hypothetical protein
MVDRMFPVIQPEDYPAFQKLVPGLPSTHDVWNARHVDALQEAMRQGGRLIDVVVYPDAFAEFLRAQGSEGSLTTLHAFAVEKARAAPDAIGGPKPLF